MTRVSLSLLKVAAKIDLRVFLYFDNSSYFNTETHWNKSFCIFNILDRNKQKITLGFTGFIDHCPEAATKGVL